jgi:hypothetical protein
MSPSIKAREQLHLIPRGSGESGDQETYLDSTRSTHGRGFAGKRFRLPNSNGNKKSDSSARTVNCATFTSTINACGVSSKPCYTIGRTAIYNTFSNTHIKAISTAVASSLRPGRPNYHPDDS